MESLRGVTEAIEAEFGESIVARDESLVVLAGAPGLGPPDLVWLQKAQKATLTSAAGEPRGFYHYSLGLDVSSSAAVAAYFAELTSRVEPISFLQVISNPRSRGPVTPSPSGPPRRPWGPPLLRHAPHDPLGATDRGPS